MKTICNFLVAAVLSIGVNQRALAGTVVGATEFTQIANNIQLLASYGEQAQQTIHQFNQYRVMLQNLERTAPSASLNQQAASLWKDRNMNKSFQDLRTVVVGGQRINYTLQNQDQVFRQLHPGYGSTFDSKTHYRNLSDNLHSSVRNAFAVSGAQADNFAREQDMIRELQMRSQTADGQMKVIQAGNDIGMAMVGQLQQLRQLHMAQMQAQNTYMEKATSIADQGQTGLDIVFGSLRSSKVVQGKKTVAPASTN